MGHRGNFPEEIWSSLKTWAKSQLDAAPSFEACCAHVRHLAEEMTGNQNSLPPQVVEFYARETVEMIVNARAAVVNEHGLA
jgi:hypothetical protein